MHDRRFEWDEDKYDTNLTKHGIRFEEAETVFDDPNAFIGYDLNHSDDEDRFNIIGFSAHYKILIVCHCYKDDGNVIRIISARKATATETKAYGGARRD